MAKRFTMKSIINADLTVRCDCGHPLGMHESNDNEVCARSSRYPLTTRMIEEGFCNCRGYVALEYPATWLFVNING